MRQFNRSDGQSVVELALMFPFLLFMALVIAEMGFGFYQQIVVRNAASEAARHAAVGALPSAACAAGSIQDRAISTTGSLLTCGGTDVITVTYQDPVNGAYGRRSGVAVRIEHEHPWITPLPAIFSLISGGAFPSAWSLNACADSRLEVIPANQAVLTPGPDCS